ncbi:helix-turn-helix domain-containing protein [Campylobacter concisus]|uniref:helix-turn-helix domain-containing protein n=1 Tax=Campylobacter concisus TaxID=199 RepID=UPI0015E196F3|nr:helix-turn-helix domain-containing protein [Campylobacter concisus]
MTKTPSVARKEDKAIYLDKKESQLLEILCKNSPHVVTYDKIDHHLYKNETLSQDRIRSLVREIRAKIPTICLKTVRDTGYKVERVWGLVKFRSYLRAKFLYFWIKFA